MSTFSVITDAEIAGSYHNNCPKGEQPMLKIM